jgi:hypothetical protein
MIDTGTSPFIISPAKDRKYPTKDLRDPSKDRNHLRYNSRRENMERAEVTAAKESSGEDDESTAVGSESTAADSEVHQGHRLDSKEGNMEHVFASTEFSVLANTDVRGGSLGGPEGVSAGSKGGPWEIRSCLSRARIITGRGQPMVLRWILLVLRWVLLVLRWIFHSGIAAAEQPDLANLVGA